MITFKSINIDGNVCNWEYSSAHELETQWNSDSINMNVPANDDPVFDIMVNGNHVLKEATVERAETDPIWFEDLLTYFGINIW